LVAFYDDGVLYKGESSCNRVDEEGSFLNGLLGKIRLGNHSLAERITGEMVVDDSVNLLDTCPKGKETWVIHVMDGGLHVTGGAPGRRRGKES